MEVRDTWVVSANCTSESNEMNESSNQIILLIVAAAPGGAEHDNLKVGKATWWHVAKRRDT